MPYKELTKRSKWIKTFRDKRKKFFVDKLGGKCQKCGYDKCIAALTFHHIDPSKKSFALDVNGMQRKLELVEAEIAKCQLLCHNCHAEVHYGSVE